MASNIVAYIGIDNFDNILYLSRILTKLGKKVLIIDHSESLSIKYSIPQPEGVNCNREIITYRQVDFTMATLTREIVDLYDDILISYGFLVPEDDISYCNLVVYVTDLYQFNQERLVSQSDLYHLTENARKVLLIKVMIDIKISSEHITEQVREQLQLESVSVLYRDEQDYSNGLICHYNGVFRFTDISKKLKKYLMVEVSQLHKDINKEQLRTAYRRARRGD